MTCKTDNYIFALIFPISILVLIMKIVQLLKGSKVLITLKVSAKMEEEGSKKGKFFNMKRFKPKRDSDLFSTTLGPPSQEMSEMDLKGGYQEVQVQIPEELPLNQREVKSWSHRIDFILAALGYSVGLGNLWRFPVKVFENGGGTFLIPYFTILILCGLPMFFLELVVGQYISYGPVKVFRRMAPLFTVSLLS